MSLNWIVARLREPSTWRGLIWLLTACGVTLRPEIWEQITAIGMAAAGLMGVLGREEPTRVDIQLPPIELVGQSRVAESAHPVADRRDPAGSRMQRTLPPDYSPKEPAHPVNNPPGWNG